METAIDTNPKTAFQTISTQMESLLEQYKSHYPKNLGEITRRRLGLIMLVLCVSAVVGGYLSTNFFLYVSAMCAAPGMLIFALVMLVTETRRKELSPNLLKDIGKLQEQLEPLTVFPDVKKYCNSFTKRLSRATDYKKRIQNIFNTCFIIFASICAFVLLFIFYGFVNVEDPFSDKSFTGDSFAKQTSDYVSQQVHLNSNLICTLSPLLPNDLYDDNPSLRFYLSPDDFAVSADITDVCVPYVDTLYVLLITDLNGVPVPRAPAIVIEGSDDNASFYFRTDGNIDLVRIIKYLNENQNNLRYNIEILE